MICRTENKNKNIKNLLIVIHTVRNTHSKKLLLPILFIVKLHKYTNFYYIFFWERDRDLQAMVMRYVCTVPQSCITNCFVLARHHCACLSDQSQLCCCSSCCFSLWLFPLPFVLIFQAVALAARCNLSYERAFRAVSHCFFILLLLFFFERV